MTSRMGYRFLLELRSCLHYEFDFRFGAIFNSGLNPYQGLHVCIDAIRHEIELSIWGYEGDQPLRIKFIKSHTLMELDIL